MVKIKTQQNLETIYQQRQNFEGFHKQNKYVQITISMILIGAYRIKDKYSDIFNFLKENRLCEINCESYKAELYLSRTIRLENAFYPDNLNRFLRFFLYALGGINNDFKNLIKKNNEYKDALFYSVAVHYTTDDEIEFLKKTNVDKRYKEHVDLLIKTREDNKKQQNTKKLDKENLNQIPTTTNNKTPIIIPQNPFIPDTKKNPVVKNETNHKPFYFAIFVFSVCFIGYLYKTKKT